jgi:hypothetical protein
MKIIDADGTVRKEMFITNDVDDVGNMIAEKRLDESKRFEVLCNSYYKRFVRAEKLQYQTEKSISAFFYKDNWIAEFLSYESQLN